MINNTIIKKHKKIILITAFSLLLILVLVFYFSFTKEIEKIEEPDDIITDYQESTLIPIKFLSDDELSDLGLQAGTRAQIIKDEPLIYKIIESDDEIITDVAPHLQTIRDNK